MLSAAITLFLMMDPIGNVPVFTALLNDVSDRRRTHIIIRENLVALIAMLGFLWFGPTIMGLLHLQQEALSVAGGIVLLIVSLEMIFPGRKSSYTDPAVVGEPFIVPLAIPLIAGPSTITALMLMVSNEPEHRPDWTLALLMAWVASLVILLLSAQLRRWLGQHAVLAIERLMGMVLLVLAVQMTMTGLLIFLQSLRAT
jgi:multiple antibiotic resistance protein